MKPVDNTSDGSYSRAVTRFSRPHVAKDYPSEYDNSSRRDRTEKAAILRTLKHIKPGGHVLDLPCGTGRLSRLLLEQGFEVTGADSSASMLEHAAENHRQRLQAAPNLGNIDFELADVMHTPYDDEQFDAVISNRLFHHFNTSELRRPAIAELARISSGPVIISFFNSFSLSAQWRRLKRRIKGVTPKDRIPIPRALLEADLESQGLKAIDWHATRWGISPHWYVVAVKRQE